MFGLILIKLSSALYVLRNLLVKCLLASFGIDIRLTDGRVYGNRISYNGDLIEFNLLKLNGEVSEVGMTFNRTDSSVLLPDSFWTTAFGKPPKLTETFAFIRDVRMLLS